MRRTVSRSTKPPVSRAHLALLMSAAICAASVAHAAPRDEMSLGLAQPSAPPGEGWSVVSRSLDAPVLTASASSGEASRTAASARAVKDGWQMLASGIGSTKGQQDASASAPSAVVKPIEVPMPPPEPPFELVRAKSIQTQLQGWAKRAGWAVTWKSQDDWLPPHDGNYGTDFESAIQQVFAQLGENGADIRADIWKGNRTVVVEKSGADE